jgi:hypothetical protein
MPVALPSKRIQFTEYSVDVSVHTEYPLRVQKRVYLRPLRVVDDGRICVIYGERAWPLYLDSKGELVILIDSASYPLVATQFPIVPLDAAVPYFEMPLDYMHDEKLSWKIERNQFGVFVYLNAEDALIEKVVTYLIEYKHYNVVSWGEAAGSDFAWSIRLSEGLSVDNVNGAITMALERDLNSPQPITNDNQARLQQLQKEVEELRTKHSHKESALIAELEEVYKELENVINENQTLRLSIDAARVGSDVHLSRVQSMKRGVAEKLIAQILFSALPQLAFPPDSVSIIVSRFSESTSLWKTLFEINHGHRIKFEKINGLAGRLGWIEIQKHINTGKDNRGRIYCRPSSLGHRYDVVLHWKQDDKEQQYIFNRLANYQPFESTRIVLL